MKKKYKNICLISDSYIPQKISAAGMIYNLSRGLIDKKIKVTCIFSGKLDKNNTQGYCLDGLSFLTTSIFSNFRNKSLIFRFIFEITTAITLAIKSYFYFKKKQKLDLIIWYGPSVFLWIVVKAINFNKTIPVYYILRDIFPDWLVNLKIVKNPILISLLNYISNPQYTVSDVIGVETFENIKYIKKKVTKDKRIQLLFNWPNLTPSNNKNIDKIIKFKFQEYIDTVNKNTMSSLYLGNASVAHDYKSMLSFFKKLYAVQTTLIKFDINIFGKSDRFNINNDIEINQNFWGLVSEQSIPFILSKVDVGIVSLNRKSLTQNIPGKFVSYTQNSLPVICFANINSALAKLVLNYDCGIIIDLELNFSKNLKIFIDFTKNLRNKKVYFANNSFKLYEDNFDTKSTINKILNSFEKR